MECLSWSRGWLGSRAPGPSAAAPRHATPRYATPRRGAVDLSLPCPIPISHPRGILFPGVCRPDTRVPCRGPPAPGVVRPARDRDVPGVPERRAPSTEQAVRPACIGRIGGLILRLQETTVHSPDLRGAGVLGGVNGNAALTRRPPWLLHLLPTPPPPSFRA